MLVKIMLTLMDYSSSADSSGTVGTVAGWFVCVEQAEIACKSACTYDV
jgi:hypothetical protein